MLSKLNFMKLQTHGTLLAHGLLVLSTVKAGSGRTGSPGEAARCARQNWRAAFPSARTGEPPSSAFPWKSSAGSVGPQPGGLRLASEEVSKTFREKGGDHSSGLKFSGHLCPSPPWSIFDTIVCTVSSSRPNCLPEKNTCALPKRWKNPTFGSYSDQRPLWAVTCKNLHRDHQPVPNCAQPCG